MNKLILDELRHLILQKFKINRISPSDCQHIALEIARKTKKNISETTLKRLFGFAATNYQFSKFTINTILDFFEDEDIPSLTHYLASSEEKLEEQQTDELSNRARLISRQTFEEVSSNANIPFDFTIARKFATHDFTTFYHSSYTYTSFISQSGYGKSMLMSHLVNDNFLTKDAKYQHDILLYLTADKLFPTNTDYIDLEHLVFEILGIKTQQSIFDHFDDIHEKSGKKLIIIVDSLWQVCSEKGAKQTIFNSIVQFLTKITHARSIKFIFGARTYIWRRFYENIKHAASLKSKWFKGSYYNEKQHTNVPVFSSSEIRQLLQKIGVNDTKLHPFVLAELKYPFYFSYFYHRKDQSDLGGKLVYFQLADELITKKFNRSNNQTAQLAVCKLIVELSNFGKNGDMINKSLLIGNFHKIKHAYMQLLFAGILSEEKYEANGFQVEYVKFTHPSIFNYFIYKNISEKKGFKYCNLADQVHHTHLMEVINWLIFYDIAQFKYQSIIEVLNLSLQPNELTDVLSLISEQLAYNLKNQLTSIALEQHSIERVLVKSVIQSDILDPKFETILETIIKLSVCDRTKIYCHNLLTLHDCLTLNLIGLEQRLDLLKSTGYQSSDSCIDPIELIDHSIAKLTCQKYNRQFLLQHYHSLIALEAKDQDSAKMIEITLAILEWLFDDGNILINEIVRDRYLNPLKRAHTSIHFQYMIHLLRTDNLSRTTTVKARQLEQILSTHTERHPYPTFFGRALTYLIKIQIQINTGNFAAAILELERATGFYQQHQLKLLEIKCYKLAIIIYENLADQDKIIEYRYLLMDMLETKSIKNHKLKLALIST